ncbi:MAG: NAD-dependent epimerase/dehydratase family protein [Flavobacteriaceae bacterium]|nr:NAD-dependent epimerase/dehydratase family protein [Flavobacteriaceae bacterium]
MVTGATGLVGSNLLYRLTEKSDKNVCGLYRSDSKRDKVEDFFASKDQNHPKNFNKIKWRKADLLHLADLDKSLEGISRIYHCASLISFYRRDKNRLYKNNVVGTSNLVNLAISNGIKKIFYISSIAALGSIESQTQIIDISNSNNPKFLSYYGLSKHLAELEIWRAKQGGIDIEIVYPGVVISPSFISSSSGRLMNQIKKLGRFYTKGTISVIGIQDLCRAIDLLMNLEIKQNRWILVSHNLLIKEFVAKVNALYGKKAPTFKIGFYHWKILTLIDQLTRLFGISFFSGINYKSASSEIYYDGSEIKKMTDFFYTSLEEILRQFKDKE